MMPNGMRLLSHSSYAVHNVNCISEAYTLHLVRSQGRYLACLWHYLCMQYMPEDVRGPRGCFAELVVELEYLYRISRVCERHSSC